MGKHGKTELTKQRRTTMTYDSDYDWEAIRAKNTKEIREYTAYVDSLKQQFGKWDMADAAALAILKLVEAQNALAIAIDESANGIDDEEEPHADIPTAVQMRAEAAVQLLQAMLLGDVWTVQLEHHFAEERDQAAARRNRPPPPAAREE
jgi:hypothetical protein